MLQGREGLIGLEKYMRTDYVADDRKWLVLFPEETVLDEGKERSKRCVLPMEFVETV